jgi:hypothetical protein
MFNPYETRQARVAVLAGFERVERLLSGGHLAGDAGVSSF